MKKYCVVPMCRSSSEATPNKLFIYVPNDPETREKWYQAARRDSFGLKKFSIKTKTVICEDHFNLEEDMENYFQFKLMGPNFSVIRMKKGIFPHKFECQEKYLSQLKTQSKSQEILTSKIKLQTNLNYKTSISQHKSKPSILKPKQLVSQDSKETFNSVSQRGSLEMFKKNQKQKNTLESESRLNISKTLPVLLPKIEEVFVVNEFKQPIDEDIVQGFSSNMNKILQITTNISKKNFYKDNINTHKIDSPALCMLKEKPNVQTSSIKQQIMPETSQFKQEKPPFKKRRIVDLIFFIEQINNLASHNESNNCSLKHLTPTTEIYNGLQSTVIFKCNNCNEMFAIDLNDNNNNELNNLLVHVAEITKLKHKGLKRLCEEIDFPLITKVHYDNIKSSTFINEQKKNNNTNNSNNSNNKNQHINNINQYQNIINNNQYQNVISNDQLENNKQLENEQQTFTVVRSKRNLKLKPNIISSVGSKMNSKRVDGINEVIIKNMDDIRSNKQKDELRYQNKRKCKEINEIIYQNKRKHNDISSEINTISSVKNSTINNNSENNRINLENPSIINLRNNSKEIDVDGVMIKQEGIEEKISDSKEKKNDQPEYDKNEISTITMLYRDTNILKQNMIKLKTNETPPDLITSMSDNKLLNNDEQIEICYIKQEIDLNEENFYT